MKKIKVSLITLIGIFLLMVGVAMGIVAISNYGKNECLQDPIGYVNENSNRYFTGEVKIIVMPLNPGSSYDP